MSLIDSVVSSAQLYVKEKSKIEHKEKGGKTRYIYIYTLCKVEAYMCVWPLPVGTVKIYLDDELEKKTSRS